MKVAIAVHGRFHAFELAGYLHRAGYLAGLTTTYPAMVARRFLPPGVPLTTAPWLEILRRAHGWTGLGPPPDFTIARAFGRFSARHLPTADVLVSWSGASVEAIAAAKHRNMLTVLERGSTHIAHQSEVLREGYARWGLTWPATDPRLIERELIEYAAADLIATGSTYARETFLARGIGPERVFVNPYGVDLSRFRPESPSVAERGRKRILFVGEVGVRKGVPWLLESFARMPADWELHLVGPLAPGFRDALARLPMARVVMRGVLSNNALVAAYREADIFCLPSIEEGFGMVILQAMASGLPVVASRATGGPDVGEDGKDVLIVPPANTPALAGALSRLAGDPALRETIGEAGARRVANEFSWNDYRRRVVEIFQARLARRS
jgi:glycosyltransferase involved in cell wall biosynthesis